MTTNNTRIPRDLEETITEIKLIGELLSRLDMDHDIPPNTLCGIGYMISRKADDAIDLIAEGGAS